MTPPWTLESLAFHWGDAYLFCYTRDRWVALRRDKRYFITADTLDGLQEAIQRDYNARRVPRDFDPAGATDYLDGEDQLQGRGDDRAAVPDIETQIILRELRQRFPSWRITYSPQLGAWVAKSRYGTFCENSMTLVCIALTRIEQRMIDWDLSHYCYRCRQP
jgi:hypothetical protein